mgnify:CR=1 FL=1
MSERLNNSIIEKLKSCNIFKEVEGWVIEYPQFDKLADEQLHTLWPWNEPDVENDIQDLRVYMSEQEQYAVTENLKLFTLYEMHVGDCYWAGRIMKKYKRPEIQRMASLFSAVEFNSHAPFYNRVNELLFLDNEEFYSSWKLDTVMSERMEMIGKAASDPNELISSAAFSFIEGAVLYSSFAFFKHFQSQACGKDLIKNVCRGINLSVGDENTHAVGGALLFNTMVKELGSAFTKEERQYVEDRITSVAYSVYEHECKLVDRLFAKGDLGGITQSNMYDFIKHRINLCLEQIKLPKIFAEDDMDGFIESWFYKDINAVALHDFFAGNGSEYNLDWKEEKFGSVWGEKL